MLNLSELRRDKLLDNLHTRFEREVIYTYVGDIILAVNPFKNTGANGQKTRDMYKGRGRKELPPHPYGLVDRAFRKMLGAMQAQERDGVEGKLSQSILISGESGAGKTEATKVCLSHICGLSTSAAEVAFKLMQTNPVMEALGNAKTVRNSNSSRFGKHFDVQFDATGKVVGALTTAYLLEKPRICTHMVGERNYHIFYMLTKAPGDVRGPLSIGSWEEYKVLNQEGTAPDARPSWDDNKEYALTHNALLSVGFTEESRAELYSMYAAILHLGNLELTPTGNADDGCTVGPQAQLELCASLLKVSAESLAEALTTKALSIAGDVTVKPLNTTQAHETRNALSTHIYMLAFSWCVGQMNDYVSRPNLATAGIALLDIFGFENFQVNGFSQLCINYTNESLQSLFIATIFKLEQDEYKAEGIEFEAVDYRDNQPIIDLIAKRPNCVLAKVDEASSMATGTDETAIMAMHDAFEGNAFAPYTKPKKASQINFIISHYAGEVIYTITGCNYRDRTSTPARVTGPLSSLR